MSPPPEVLARLRKIVDLSNTIADDAKETVSLMIVAGWDPTLAKQAYCEWITSLARDTVTEALEWAR